ncbi:MAG: GTP 3',8-cyclase MoaA [Alkaliphilus sp.]|nr:GTP 3',8-cyclase MoaA [Alkaliphilus sp.]
MIDALGRKINYLRVSVTDLCNLRCRYCMPIEGIRKMSHNQILSLEEIFKVVEAAVDLGINKVRLTGGEPLVRKGILQLVEKIATLNGVDDLALTTNGLLLKKYAKDLKDVGLKRVNISLDTMNKEKYHEITRGGDLIEVFEGIEAAKNVSLCPIKINIVVIGGFNDNEIVDFAELTKEGIDVRFIELMPIGQASSWSKSHFISNDAIKAKLPDLIPETDGDKSSPASYYRLTGASGKIGFINSISSHFCRYCNRIRLTADGKLKPCLHSNQEIDIKPFIRQGKKELTGAIRDAILAKPTEHSLNETNNKPIIRDMVRIGG